MTPDPSPRRPGWRAGDVARAAAIALAVYGVARLLLFAHTLIFVAFLGVLLGLAVAAGAERLQGIGVPRPVGAAGIVIAAVALLVGFGALSGPTIREQYGELRTRLPAAFVKLDHWLAQRQSGLVGMLLSEDNDSTSAPGESQQRAVNARSTGTDTLAGTRAQTDSLAHLKAIRDRLLNDVAGARGYVFPVAHSTVAAVTGIVLVLFIAIYVGADPGLYRNGLIALVPGRRRQRWGHVLAACADGLRRWLVMQLIAMLVIGSVTIVALLIIGVHAALPLGLLAGLLEFVPTIGPIASAVPAVAMAFVDSPEEAGIVALAYIGIQFLENHLLIPLLMKEGVNLPPVLTILTQALMALVFGVVGLFVAVPMLVLATILVKLLYVEDVVGGDAGVLPLTRHPPAAAGDVGA